MLHAFESLILIDGSMMTECFKHTEEKPDEAASSRSFLLWDPDDAFSLSRRLNQLVWLCLKGGKLKGSQSSGSIAWLSSRECILKWAFLIVEVFGLN